MAESRLVFFVLGYFLVFVSARIHVLKIEVSHLKVFLMVVRWKKLIQTKSGPKRDRHQQSIENLEKDSTENLNQFLSVP